ncbi:MAG: hypothetical protein JSU94_04880 [Phycisphaerales bacterium]|nr:MAG: hypothetical protein JSU94_04880 [Phycisphaerales bacterium]
MGYRKIVFLCLLVLGAVVLGCRREPPGGTRRQGGTSRSQVQARPSTQTTKSRYSVSTSWAVEVDVAELPLIIVGTLKDLGIAVGAEDQEAGRYECGGTSPGGLDVTVEAVAVVKGSSLLGLSVVGDEQVAKLLKDKLSQALRDAIASKGR